MGLFSKKEKTLNDRIKNLRKKKGLTQLELAELVHVTDKAVSKWETGEGNPEISILIQLSSIFEVSLDYLLTGKEPEKEVVVISKLELCCKEDNVTLFNEISSDILKGKDESGKTILDYIEKYNSKNVYFALVEKFKPSSLMSTDSRNGFRYFTPQRVLELFFKYDDIDSLNTISFFKHNLARDQWGGISTSRYSSNNNSIYVEKNVETMIKIIDGNSKIMDYALSIHKNEIINNVSNWQVVYTNILHYALLNKKKDIVDKIINLIFEINKSSVDECEQKIAIARPDERQYYRISTKPTSIVSSNYRTIYNYAVIVVPVKILEILINEGYLNEVKKLNEFNNSFKAETISTGLIAAEFMKKDGKMSKDDIYIVSCMEYGIVNIDKLLVCNDLDIVKKAFANYPICFKDMLNSKVLSKKYKELYEYAIDNDFESLAQALLLINSEKYGESYLQKKIDEVAEKVCISGNKFDVNKNYYIKKQNYGYWNTSKAKPRITTQEVVDSILKDLTFKLDKESAISGLTKQYFEELLSANNFELLIIKLCVKLEAILRCDYRYEGTFEEMLKKYSDQHLNWREDDGWGYMVDACDSKAIKTLNNLRIKRNSIVHSEKTQVDLTLDDLKYCIEFVCKLNKEA